MQKIALLYDASQAVLSTFDLDEVLKQILGILRDYFQLQNAAVLLLDRLSQELYVREHLGRTPEHVKYRIPIGKGIVGTAARLKRPIYAPDVSKDARYIKKADATRSEVAIPLIVRDEVVGVLDFQSDRENYFDYGTIDLLTLFSTQASLAIENARLYTMERKRAHQLEAINAVARQTTGTVELDELLTSVCLLLLEWFGIDHATVLLNEGESLRVRAFEGKLTPKIALGEELPAGAGLAWKALHTGKSLIVNDVDGSDRYVPGYAETQAEMCVPLILFGQKLGVLALDSARKNAFELEDVKPLESVADICAAAIQNAHYIKRVKEEAYVDGLTGIHNRRFFELRINEELERSGRSQEPIAVIMADIDNFKRLNDEFGHLLGDEVLRGVSSIFKQQLRKADMVCRYGGEEFVMVLPSASGENAFRIADKLRRQIETFIFPGVPRPVTISCGVAEWPTHGQTRDEVVAAADAALYVAKQKGRNRVMAAGMRKETSVSADI